MSKDILIGIDAGTSVIKAVAFDLSGHQLAAASEANSYHSGTDGAATQSMARTWQDCAKALLGLSAQVDDLAARTAAVAVTGQGDGTWLVDANNQPISDAWLWLDARAAPTVALLDGHVNARARFEATGTGLNTCQQGAQLAHMARHCPELIDMADASLHCKDWIYLNLTGVRATDPSEASFTFGDFRTRGYDDGVIDVLGLGDYRRLLPPILEGTETTHHLSKEAAHQTGLLAGTPVSLGYVDMVMTALGAGVFTGTFDVACSTIGSTGVHMRATRAEDLEVNAAGTGYVIALPIPGLVTQVQSNMAATLNIDWVLNLVAQTSADLGHPVPVAELVAKIDGWLARTRPATLIYHPFISAAGERGPFVDAQARASVVGLSASHGYADLVRSVVEGLGMAMRDCYTAMGDLPSEVRLTGGAARSAALRQVLAAGTGANIRLSTRQEAGAAGAAMMAAVAIGAHTSMDACIAEWVVPSLAVPEEPDPQLAEIYASHFHPYRDARAALTPVWHQLAALQKSRSS